MAEQVLRHVKQHVSLFQTFASTERAQLDLIVELREYCYDNMELMNAFQKLIILFYDGERTFLH